MRFLRLTYLNATWYEAISTDLLIDTNLLLEGLVENQNGVFELAKIFHCDPAALVVEVFVQLRWLQLCVGENRFTVHAMRNLQIHSFTDARENKTKVVLNPFSSTWWRVMMIKRNQKGFYYYLHSQLHGADLHVSAH